MKARRQPLYNSHGGQHVYRLLPPHPPSQQHASLRQPVPRTRVLKERTNNNNNNNKRIDRSILFMELCGCVCFPVLVPRLLFQIGGRNYNSVIFYSLWGMYLIYSRSGRRYEHHR